MRKARRSAQLVALLEIRIPFLTDAFSHGDGTDKSVSGRLVYRPQFIQDRCRAGMASRFRLQRGLD
jgi:hypothetical protein